MSNKELSTISTEQALQNATQSDEIRLKLQNFTQLLNAEPKPESIGKTPDGKANTIKISHIETTLDEYCFGLWSTENYRWEQIGNEIVGSIDLRVFHPVAGAWITRTGAASVVIMVDRAPDNVNKNLWALNMENKKPNALDMGFPKLKAECIKNAANSLGALFGRDLNRKQEDRDQFQGLIVPIKLSDLRELYDMKKDALTEAERQHAERIINNNETNSFVKLHKHLQSK